MRNNMLTTMIKTTSRINGNNGHGNGNADDVDVEEQEGEHGGVEMRGDDYNPK